MRLARAYGAVVLLTVLGCSHPTENLVKSVSVRAILFAEFTEAGFLFIPTNYNGDFESIGMVTIECHPEANLVEDDSESSGKKWQVEPLPIHEALQSAMQKCVELGADALTQLKIETKIESLYGRSQNPLTYDYVSISGFAIKRLGEFDSDIE